MPCLACGGRGSGCRWGLGGGQGRQCGWLDRDPRAAPLEHRLKLDTVRMHLGAWAGACAQICIWSKSVVCCGELVPPATNQPENWLSQHLASMRLLRCISVIMNPFVYVGTAIYVMAVYVTEGCKMHK